MVGIKKQANKLAVTLGLLAILAAPVAFGATPVNAWRCWFGFFRWC